MSTIITKFSDYTIHSIEYFIEKVNEELSYRDLTGLTNGRIEKINVSKQHPLAALMGASLSENRNADALRASIIPSISITPGNMTDEGFTFGKSFKSEIVDDTFIDTLKSYLDKTDKNIQSDVLITKTQIETIISAYKRVNAGAMRLQRNEWHKNEEINLSVWSDSADVDIILGNLVDSILGFIQVGFAGEDSPMRYFRYKINKGLTNFNFGRTLFGSEYSLTFLNTYNNFIIYTDPVLSGHDFYGTFEIPGEE